jgi:hypothetical protein
MFVAPTCHHISTRSARRRRCTRAGTSSPCSPILHTHPNPTHSPWPGTQAEAQALLGRVFAAVEALRASEDPADAELLDGAALEAQEALGEAEAVVGPRWVGSGCGGRGVGWVEE